MIPIDMGICRTSIFHLHLVKLDPSICGKGTCSSISGITYLISDVRYGSRQCKIEPGAGVDYHKQDTNRRLLLVHRTIFLGIYAEIFVFHQMLTDLNSVSA